MLYKLESIRRPGFTCEIETEENLDPIIREYRKSYKEESKGYHNPKGEKRDFTDYYEELYTDMVYCKEGYCPDLFWAYRDGNIVSPKKSFATQLKYPRFRGDIRRVLADILYVVYILEEKTSKKIKRLKWKDTEYTNIENVKLCEDPVKNVRIQFEARKENGDQEEILLPIPLNIKRCCLSKYTPDFYVLQRNGIPLMEYVFSVGVTEEKDKFLEGENSTVREDVSVEFFWIKDEEKTGLFYNYDKKMLPIYGITSKNELMVFENFGDSEEKCKYVRLSDEEKKHFSEEKFKGGNLEDVIEITNFIYFLAECSKELKITLDGAEYVGKKCWNEYQFSDMKAENLVIDCGVEIKKENDLFKSQLKTVDIRLENQDSFHLEKEKMAYQSKDEKARWYSWSTLKNNHVVKESPYERILEKSAEEISEKIMEEIIKEVKETCIKFVETFMNYKDEKGEEKLKELAKTKMEQEISEVERILYPSPLIPDKGVAKIIYEEKKKYEKTGKMPNFSIMGIPGCGKSTLVEKIASYMKGERNAKGWVLKKSTSDLKGAYIGQTANRVYDLLEKAYKEGKIVFIDEAYNLQSDKFGKEALEMLLPLISGDRTDIECVDLKTGERKSLEFIENVPGIWLAGYEQETREMLVENPGLYRRMVKLSLAEPTVEGLYANLLAKTKNTEMLKLVFEDCKKEIKNYFGWASAKEHIAYFGSYAGVEEFYKACKVRLEGDLTANAKSCILEIIDEKKREIKKQYKAILAKNERQKNGEVPKFEIQRDVNVILDDVKGNDSAVFGMRQIVKMLMEREVYEKEGMHVPKGALLVGPPGTGKTMLAKATAGEIQRSYDESERKEKSVAFISVVSTELNNAQKVSALFEEAAEYDSSIIFIDEIDAIGKQRGNCENSRVLFQLMKEMDGFEERKNIFVMAATNAPETIDPALKRPGRFDRYMEVSYPNEEGRKAILLSYLEKLSEIKNRIKRESGNNNLEDLAKEVAEKTVGWVPAELKNLVNEAAILHKEIEENKEKMLKNKHREKVTSQSAYECFRADIFEALERIRIGELVEGRKEADFQDSENKGSSAVAIHEVGHGLVSILLGLEPFERITIISRGDALGYVSPSRKNVLRTKTDYLKQIKVCLGGRIAEEIFYGEDISIGAVQDIQNATKYAEDMVMLFGMSDEIGPMAIKAYRKNYLGNEQSYRCSSEFLCKAEDEVNKILKKQLEETKELLQNQKYMIGRLAKYVFEKETLTGSEFKEEYERIDKEV